MIDGIIKADGTSRLMRAELPATYEEFRAQCLAGTQPLDVLFNAIGWSQMPTFLNKASLLKDATAALFGLGKDAVPDDVLGLLSRFHAGLGNEYVWAKQADGLVDVVVKSSVTTTVDLGADNVVDAYATAGVVGGEIVLSYKVSDIYPYDNAVGYYAYYNGSPYYLTAFESSGPNSIKFSANLLTVGQETVKGTVGYVNSPNPNAYPIDDGYTYTALGQLGAKVQIATGSYTGTGTYGKSNPNSLTFDFEPKLLVVLMSGKRSFSNEYGFIWVAPDSALGFAATSNTYVPSITVNENVVSWYQTNAEKWQCNESGTTYNYFAIG